MKFLVSILLSCGLVGPVLEAQAPNQKVASYSVQADTFIDALLKSAARFELPLAVEWVKAVPSRGVAHR